MRKKYREQLAEQQKVIDHLKSMGVEIGQNLNHNARIVDLENRVNQLCDITLEVVRLHNTNVNGVVQSTISETQRKVIQPIDSLTRNTATN